MDQIDRVMARVALQLRAPLQICAEGPARQWLIDRQPWDGDFAAYLSVEEVESGRLSLIAIADASLEDYCDLELAVDQLPNERFGDFILACAEAFLLQPEADSPQGWIDAGRKRLAPSQLSFGFDDDLPADRNGYCGH
jgi:hypothetical protein